MKGLSLQNLSVSYGEKLVIENLTLVVEGKDILVLMGLSGSGKTTLLKTVLGIESPCGGKIILEGKEITHLPIEKRNIGYVPQDRGLFPHLSVWENVAYGLRIRGVSLEEQHEKVRSILRAMDIVEYERNRVYELSGGQQQRVALARALVIEPDLLLLDEPLSSIDQATKFEVATHLKVLFQSIKIPILFVTHQHEDARFFGGQLAVMVDGQIVQKGPSDEVMNNPKTEFIKRLLIPFFAL